MSRFHYKEFTNTFGHVIQPGDEVYYVTTSKYPGVELHKGVYEGYFEGWSGPMAKVYKIGQKLRPWKSRYSILRNNLMVPVK
jgi:hypothetical protein